MGRGHGRGSRKASWVGGLGAGGGGIGQGFQLNCKKSRGKGGTPQKATRPSRRAPSLFYYLLPMSGSGPGECPNDGM